MHRRFHGTLVCFTLSWIVLAAAGTLGQGKPAGKPDPKTLKNPVPATAGSIAAGQQVFQKYCRTCHGNAGRGDGPQPPEGSHPANLTDDKWDHGGTDGEIFTTIHDGVGPKFDMDEHGSKLTDLEIWNVVNFVRTLGPKPKPGRGTPKSH